MNSPQQDPVMLLPPEQRVQRWADQAWPLRFTSHGFGVRCWNIQRCSVIYDNREFGPRDLFIDNPTTFLPSGPPPRPDWKEHWDAHYTPYDSDLLTPVKIEWTSLDGSERQTTVDLDTIFKDRLVLHNVKREDIPVGWLAAWGKDPFPAHILLEVNDRTVNVYFKAAIVSCDTADPDNLDKRQTHRDLILAWTHTY